MSPVRREVRPRFPLSALAKHPRYAGKTNEELCALWQEGDRSALGVLVELNQGIVYLHARRHLSRCSSLTIDDLAVEGSMGLMRAARDFSLEYGASFCTYAGNWVRAFVARAADNDVSLLTVPGRSAKGWAGPRYARWVTHFLEEVGLGYDAAHEAARKAMGLTRGAARCIRDLWRAKGTKSLDAPVFDESESGTLHDVISSASFEQPDEEDVDEGRVLDRVRALRPTLSDKEVAVLDGRFFGGETLEEVGHKLGVSRERVRQIEEKLLRKVKVHLASPKERQGAIRAARGNERFTLAR
jgi:RNA polymerase primary sigma factor